MTPSTAHQSRRKMNALDITSPISHHSTEGCDAPLQITQTASSVPFVVSACARVWRASFALLLMPEVCVRVPATLGSMFNAWRGCWITTSNAALSACRRSLRKPYWPHGDLSYRSQRSSKPLCISARRPPPRVARLNPWPSSLFWLWPPLTA